MKIAVIPDGAMIIINFIVKKGHTYISPSNFSKRTAEDGFWDEDKINLPSILKENNIIYNFSDEIPSGVKGRFKLFNSIIKEVDACIILGVRNKNYKRMYGILNELILFGGCGCVNEHKLIIKTIKDLNIPKLILKHPNNQNELINLITNLNEFLDNLELYRGENITFNLDNLNIELSEDIEKFPIDEFKTLIKKSY